MMDFQPVQLQMETMHPLSSCSKTKPFSLSDTRHSDNNGQEENGDVQTKTRAKVKKPSLYRVLLLNDDYTPMDFVIHVLQKFFHKNQEDATEIMLRVHHTGVGECGVYTYEVAESKASAVIGLARQNQYPLQCAIEKE
ncbi:MAG: ATP-dependent Clp protease adapter protein ClpS [Candidatus Tokpelaia hoelldobleri]|uniref:ATP-dependent Clp protease adapter protein ClpS n=1 Tax=Candidatus Tokpelaia hoelldobleri TaxID=1902579 RepID=A0A1U9JUA6_9HYPH|nr:MAG: ATP-dependent Clp protease adapter protein ClpS [Candidatus Tokpelaia hoelldoblerii]